MEKVSVFKNLSSPLIIGYDGIDNQGITHLSRSKKFAFQEDLNPEIPAHCGMPVRLGTSLGKDQPMLNGLKAVSTVASPDFPSLFAQPGLVCPNAQGCGTILLQNCGDSDITLPRCKNIAFIESLSDPQF